MDWYLFLHVMLLMWFIPVIQSHMQEMDESPSPGTLFHGYFVLMLAGIIIYDLIQHVT